MAHCKICGTTFSRWSGKSWTLCDQCHNKHVEEENRRAQEQLRLQQEEKRRNIETLIDTASTSGRDQNAKRALNMLADLRGTRAIGFLVEYFKSSCNADGSVTPQFTYALEALNKLCRSRLEPEEASILQTGLTTAVTSGPPLVTNWAAVLLVACGKCPSSILSPGLINDARKLGIL